ncbi:MAG TPA: TolC family protein [Pedobacter sp.]|jgi:outer membrane protein TolC
MRSRLLLAMMLVLSFSSAKAQVKQDTLGWRDFINIVKKNHPVTQQAKLQLDLARARRTQALGGFDPKIGLNYDRKLFDGTEYYTFLTPEVKLPLWFGAELKGNFTDASGAFINPENKVPKEGLSYAGLSIPVGKGLLFDRRRANLRQAAIFERSSENERAAILNNLFIEAGESYINWENKYRIYNIYENTVALAQVRLDAVKAGFKGGDRPAIDTLEAASQLQQRELQLQQSNLDLISAVYDLSTYLWLNNTQAVDPDKLNVVPQAAYAFPVITDTGIENNPKLRSFEFKLQSLEVERRLKVQSLLPEFNLQLGLLNSGRSALSNVNPNYWNNNNKVGLQFSIPLTLSTARGELAEAKIKIRETELEQSVVRVELDNKVKQSLAAIKNTSYQVEVLKQLYQANKQLLQGEETRFKLGESSLFLVNARESKLLEVYEKLIETEAKLRKAEIKLNWLTGSLTEYLK